MPSFAIIAGVTALAGCEAAVTSVGQWLPEASTGFYLEAENGELSGGFTVGSDNAASGGRHIEPPAGAASQNQPGQARARYEFDVATRGNYLVWGRIHSPDASHNTFWFQFDGGPWFLWRITTGEVWYWIPFHENANYGSPMVFDFDVGKHELVIANAIDADRLDRFYMTADGDTPPGNDTPCDPPHSVQLDGGCSPSCGSQGGNRCGAMACSGRQILPAYDCDLCCIGP